MSGKGGVTSGEGVVTSGEGGVAFLFIIHSEPVKLITHEGSRHR